jgi:NDP-sugar pyrophosphorylase family protein
MQVHRDIMDGRYASPPFEGKPSSWIAPDARVDAAVEVHAPCFVGEGAVVKAGAKIYPYAVIGRQSHVEEGAVVDGSIVWPNGWIGADAALYSAILGRNCHIGRNAVLRSPSVLGDKTVITDFSHF